MSALERRLMLSKLQNALISASYCKVRSIGLAKPPSRRLAGLYDSRVELKKGLSQICHSIIPANTDCHPTCLPFACPLCVTIVCAPPSNRICLMEEQNRKSYGLARFEGGLCAECVRDEKVGKGVGGMPRAVC